MKIDKSKYDVSQIFLTYMTLVGDVDKTASALDLDPRVVQALASSEGWEEKARRLTLMSKGGKPGDYERAANRALNYVQAHRLRMLLSSLLAVYEDKDPGALPEQKRPGNNALVQPSCRFFADLAAAMEKAQFLTYTALGDTVGERESRMGHGEGEVNASAIHAAVLSALNATSVKDITPTELIQLSQKAYVDEVKEMAKVNPDACTLPSAGQDLPST